MTITRVLASKETHPYIAFACGVAATIYNYEGVPLLVTNVDGFTIDFSTQSLFHGKARTIHGQLKTLLTTWGFEVEMEPKVIRCTFDPKGDGL